jgi:hypothetical protein
MLASMAARSRGFNEPHVSLFSSLAPAPARPGAAQNLITSMLANVDLADNIGAVAMAQTALRSASSSWTDVVSTAKFAMADFGALL